MDVIPLDLGFGAELRGEIDEQKVGFRRRVERAAREGERMQCRAAGSHGYHARRRRVERKAVASATIG